MYIPFTVPSEARAANALPEDSCSTPAGACRSSRIESDARRLYAALRPVGRTTVNALCSGTQLSAAEGLLALGWLVRDGRVEIVGTEVQDLSSDFYF